MCGWWLVFLLIYGAVCGVESVDPKDIAIMFLFYLQDNHDSRLRFSIWQLWRHVDDRTGGAEGKTKL